MQRKTYEGHVGVGYDKRLPFNVLAGLTLTEIEEIRTADNSDVVELVLHTADRKFVLLHRQDCCEYVRLCDVVGDFKDLLNTPIVMAEEATNAAKAGEVSDSGTWTFYKLATNKGTVTMRWLGESNGYYSEAVDLYEVTEASNDGN